MNKRLQAVSVDAEHLPTVLGWKTVCRMQNTQIIFIIEAAIVMLR